jgi:Rrf2 family transcriptional regulator, cysteine metabolism repressor
MMPVSQKCQYALRALFELARTEGAVPIKMAEIAKRQAIPLRFLEIILHELKRGGFVRALRGKDGGCMLARPPQEVTVGEIVRFVEGSLAPVTCIKEGSEESCALYGSCVFLPLWERAERALAEVYDGTTLKDLLDQEAELRMKCRMIADYSI